MSIRFAQLVSLAVRPVIRRARGMMTLGALMILIGCKGLTDVDDPSNIVDPGIVTTPDGAIGLYRGAVNSFNMITGGSNPSFSSSAPNQSYLLADALASDQMLSRVTGAFVNFNLRLVGTSTIDGADMADPYTRMHTARLYIDQAIGTLREFGGTTTPTSFIGELQALRGYLYILFGEMYCSGVPFSRAIYGGDIDFGQPLTTEEMFEAAIASFDSALVASTDSVRIQRLAYVGKARAMLNLGQFTEAAGVAGAANVPTSFVHNMAYGAPPFANFLAYMTHPSADDREGAIADRAGGVGLDYLSAGDAVGVVDPRVRHVLSTGFNKRPMPAKYFSTTAPVTLAGGVEARLIEAEAALRAGDIGGWEAILNTLRQTASTPPIPALTPDSTTAASPELRENVMFRERAFWLFMTGHRLGDMRRLVRQYGRGPQAVFPRGIQALLPSPRNIYSEEMNFEPPLSEIRNNPHYDGCFNRDA